MNSEEAVVFKVHDQCDASLFKSISSAHRKQIHREPWPNFSELDLSQYDNALRVEAAHQWATRAGAEHSSVFQFSQLSQALSLACVPIEILGALARLITDEVRHVQLCLNVAKACAPPEWSHLLKLPAPYAPWAPFNSDARRDELLAWASRAVLLACCLGESLSKPMLEVIALQSTEPVIEAATLQILRDEELHSLFGWETLRYLMNELSPEAIEVLHGALPRAFAGLEQTTAHGITVADLVGKRLTVTRSKETPNLGVLSAIQSATVFYSTLDSMIFPELKKLGFDPQRAWQQRFHQPA
ncbi:MAG: hypothetical protein P1V97_07650 [Planctomycetota bacterium]|nr:hypothetical protein [Planctomycetota bacterium]